MKLISVITFIVLAVASCMQPYDSVPKDVEVDAVCTQNYVALYNQTIKRAEKVQKAVAEGKDPAQELASLQNKCDDLFLWYPVDYGCVAKRDDEVLFVHIGPLADLCDHPQQISFDSDLPKKIKAYKSN